ncbi:DUF3791 domain-containing protein [uncultured Clostridium sp.]
MLKFRNSKIIPCYEHLHAQGKAYIVDDLIQLMTVKKN